MAQTYWDMLDDAGRARIMQEASTRVAPYDYVPCDPNAHKVSDPIDDCLDWRDHIVAAK